MEQQHPRPAVILLHGYPSTGKTTSAQRLFFQFTPRLRVSLLTTLSVRLSLGEMKNLRDECARAAVYERLAALAEEKIRDGDELVILDGNFVRRERRRSIYELGSRYGADVYLVECVVDNDDAIRLRLAYRQKRGGDPQHQASTMELYEFIKNSSDPVIDDRLPDGRSPIVVRYRTDTQMIRVGGAASLDEAQRGLVGQVVEALQPPRCSPTTGSPATAVRAVIFDIGGVIQPLRWDRVVAEAKTLNPDVTVDEFRNAFYSEREKYFGLYETSHMTGLEFWEMVAAKLRIPASRIDNLSAALERLYAGIDEDVLQLIERLASRYRLYTLSNSCPELERAILAPGLCYRYFDRMYFSHRIGLRKPFPKSYRYVLTDTGWQADQCVFVDDVPANVAAASEVGMRSILYASPDQLERDLGEQLRAWESLQPADV